MGFETIFILVVEMALDGFLSNPGLVCVLSLTHSCYISPALASGLHYKHGLAAVRMISVSEYRLNLCLFLRHCIIFRCGVGFLGAG